MAAAVADPDPVLYYEHIALYRDPRIKQSLRPRPPGAAGARPGGAPPARRRPRDRLVRRVRARRDARGGCACRRRHQASVLDLRTLVPLDKDAVLQPSPATAAAC